METEATPPDSTPHQFLAFSCVFSGMLSKGQKLFVLQPRYDPTLTPSPSYKPRSLKNLTSHRT